MSFTDIAIGFLHSALFDDRKKEQSLKAKNKEIINPALLAFDTVKEPLVLNDIRTFKNQNAIVTGMSGAGKTYTSKTIIKSHFNASNPRIIIIDNKDDYSPRGENIEDFYKEIRADYWIVDREPLPFNPFAFPLNLTDDTKENKIRDIAYRFTDLISSLSPKVGGVQMGELRELIKIYLNQTDKPSLLAFNAWMNQEGIEVKGEWYYKIFVPILDYRIFSNHNIHFNSIMTGEKNLIFNTTALNGTHQLLVSLAVMFFLNDYMKNSKKATTVNFLRKMEVLYVVDEAGALVSTENNERFKEFMQKNRQYGFNTIFGFQNRNDSLKNKSINWGSVVSLVLNGQDDNVPELAELGLGEFKVKSSKLSGVYKVV
jgi:type IV secretory pathway VirB4 component